MLLLLSDTVYRPSAKIYGATFHTILQQNAQRKVKPSHFPRRYLRVLQDYSPIISLKEIKNLQFSKEWLEEKYISILNNYKHKILKLFNASIQYLSWKFTHNFKIAVVHVCHKNFRLKIVISRERRIALGKIQILL